MDYRIYDLRRTIYDIAGMHLLSEILDSCAGLAAGRCRNPKAGAPAPPTESALDFVGVNAYLGAMRTAEVNMSNAQLAELVKEVQAGHEIILTQRHKPVAKLVPASLAEMPSGTSLQIRSLKGHRVLTPVISQSELADEMLGG